jgi:hypothetical protein
MSDGHCSSLVKGFGFGRWPSAKLYKEFDLYAIRQYARIGALACVEMKMIVMPYAGELHVRFNEGEQVLRLTDDSKRARSWKRRIQPTSALTNAVPVLYSTHISQFLLRDEG